MAKEFHEIRDPIHVFVRLDTDERRVLDSLPFQRLRHIRQLAMTYLVYPGATHTRFEHSLGVMELATRVNDVITRQENIHPAIREWFQMKGNGATGVLSCAWRLFAMTWGTFLFRMPGKKNSFLLVGTMKN